jgi:hypothetical protein
MSDPSLLVVVERRFGVAVDRDSDAGRILDSLTPGATFGPTDLTGQAASAPLSFAIGPTGVNVGASGAPDSLAFTLPTGPIDFRLVPQEPADPGPRVEITLLSPAVPLPFLRAAEVGRDGTPAAIPGGVTLHLPDLLLIVGANTGAPSTVRLAPRHDGQAELVATMTPPTVLIGPGTVVAITVERASLRLDASGPVIELPDVAVNVIPPGIPALALQGAGRDVRIGLGLGDGLSGDFVLRPAEGPVAAGRPRFVRDLAGHLRLDRNAVTRLEVSGTIDVAGEITARIGDVGDPASEIVFSLALALDSAWRAELSLRPGAGGESLWRVARPIAGAQDIALETLGALAVFAPLLGPTPPAAAPGDYASLAIAAGAAAVLAATDAVTTESVVLHGANLVVRQPVNGTPDAFVFLDVEVELSLDVEVGGVTLLGSTRPLKVRHRSIGLRLEFGPSGASPALHPVFDPRQGFSIDLSDPGILEVPGDLGDIVQPTAARIARDNPLQLEVDLALKADLGIVSVDEASVRIPLDPAGPPSLSALGAHVEVPGVITGGGYLRLEPTGGFAGRIDVALAPPLGLRAAAGLAIRHLKPPLSSEELDAVLVTLELELPVPIPLANSGLGLFGFLGLFGMHHERNQGPHQSALGWFVEVARGDATRISAWKASPHRWALGLGAIVGTVEGGFLFHAKGMIVIELPGPRLLIVMNADFLGPRPPTKGDPKTARLLAIIEIRPESLTIGVVAEYAIEPLLELRVPAEAFFDFTRPENWHLDIGGIPPKLPVSVRFLSSFRADGYLLIHGGGIPDFPLRPLGGFSVAAGIRAAFTWGPEEIGLYLRVTAQADVGISFKPMLVIGMLTLRGELHLFIVSVEASAAATVMITPDAFWISAEVCGSVDFFFFDVSACVTLELGAEPTRLPPAEPLVRALSLHSRAPALVHGSGSGAPVDGSLTDAAHLDESGQFVGNTAAVPIDAIPVLQFEMRPAVDPACLFLGRAVLPKLSPGDWVRRGERFYRYTLRSMALTGVGADGNALPSPVTQGETPTAWWDRPGSPSGGEDSDVQLALLSWIPDPTPAAAERTTSLDERVQRRWGGVCVELAPPACVLWSFERSAAGPSPGGWTLTGVRWPDDPGTIRSAAPALTARVYEPWRSGESIADALAQVAPAYVFGAEGIAGRLLIAPRTGIRLQPVIQDDSDFIDLFAGLLSRRGDRLGDALRIDTAGLRLIRLLLFVSGVVGTDGTLVVRPLDGDGNATGSDQQVKPPDALTQLDATNVPSEWIDANRPWMALIEATSEAWTRYRRALDADVEIVLMTADLPENTTQVEIGLVRDVSGDQASWGLLVFDGLTESELLRFRFDSEERDRQIDTINGALGADQSKRALLQPGATYTMTVVYDVLVADADPAGNPKTASAQPTTGLKQQFRFTTDSRPPERLDPWVLASSPAEGESNLFHGDPLRVVFSTNATRALFKTYGSELVAVARAASGNHPDAAAAFEGLGAIVRTPFEDALLGAVAGGSCITAGQADRHERLTLTLPLEPMTNYILDIEPTPRPAPPADKPAYPLFRRQFSTSRYATMQALATDVFGRTPVHRAVQDASALTALAALHPGSTAVAVSDVELEQVLRAIRWGDLARPADPRVTVLWATAPGVTSERAVAILLETPEPLWRWRDVPEHVTDPNGTRRWELRQQASLEVGDTGAAGTPTRLVHSTDGARTVVVLSPFVIATGGRVALELRRMHHPLFEGDVAVEREPLVTLKLARPPWVA